MTYLEFEKIVKGYLEESLLASIGKKIQINHQTDVKPIEGSPFNIDLSCEFEIGPLRYLTIVECKHWNHPVPRDVIVLFEQKRVALKAQKAVVITSSHFQSGALEFAKINNIGLIQITNNGEITKLNHFAGNFNSFKEQLQKEQVPLDNSTQLFKIGIVTPSQSLRDYFLKKYKIDLRKIEIDSDTGAWKSQELKNPFEKLRDIPSDWVNDYITEETGGLPLVLENESEIRIVEIWINMSTQNVWA